MTITRSGANQAYSNNWAKAFGGRPTKMSVAAVATKAKTKAASKKKASRIKSRKK